MALFNKALKLVGALPKKLLSKGSPKKALRGLLGGGLLSKIKNAKSQAQLQQAGVTEGAMQAGTVAPEAVGVSEPKLGTQATDVAPAGQLGGVMDPAVAAAAEAERKRKKAQQIAGAGPRTILGG